MDTGRNGQKGLNTRGKKYKSAFPEGKTTLKVGAGRNVADCNCVLFLTIFCPGIILEQQSLQR